MQHIVSFNSGLARNLDACINPEQHVQYGGATFTSWAK